MQAIQKYILEQVATNRLERDRASALLKELTQHEPANTNETKQDIAVVGVACRFPNADNARDFWTNMMQGDDAIETFPTNRIDDIRYLNEQSFAMLRGAKFKLGGYLKQVDLFDPDFFQITPAEAKAMDPNQRLFLETAWEALESAGASKEKLSGSLTGVYVGYSYEEGYKKLLEEFDGHAVLGNMPAVIPARLSYLLNLKGPSMIFDTTCSSSLVALHHACQAIRAGDCRQAVVGGVQTLLLPLDVDGAEMGTESADGKCRSFDADASGTNVAEGVGVIVIKPLEDAITDNDHIYCVIKGSAINSDGASNGLTAPNPESQAEVIKRSWKNAGISPTRISYIEAHGTGTKLGDPIEIDGLKRAFRSYTDDKQFCAIGSVKTNIGHLDAAAGIAGVIKTALALYYKKIPASLHFETPNPLIDFSDSPVYVNKELQEWKTDDGPRLAGVSAFGLSGTNCHVVLEEYTGSAVSEQSELAQQVFTISAKTKRALFQSVEKTKQFLQQNDSWRLVDLCYSMSRRDSYSHRIAIKAKDTDELKAKLTRVAAFGSYEMVSDEMREWGIGYACTSMETRIQRLESTSVEDIFSGYLNGWQIDWNRVYANTRCQVVPLPAYGFDQKRFWPKLGLKEQRYEEIDASPYLFDAAWMPKELQNGLTATEETKFWLIFSEESDLENELLKELKLRKEDYIIVRPSQHFSRQSLQEFTIHPAHTSDYDLLVSALGANVWESLTGLIHMWNCSNDDDSMHDLKTLEESQYKSAYSLFYLMKSLQKHRISPKLQMNIATSYAFKANGSEPTIYPVRATLAGLAKVISQEMPKIVTYCIDLDTKQMSGHQAAQAILTEVSQPKGERDELVAIRKDGGRLVQVLARHNPAPVADRKRALKENGVYLIIGAGYLGMEIGKYMAEKHNVNLAFITRTALPARDAWESLIKNGDENSRVYSQVKGILDIEKSGSKTIHLSADATSFSEMEQAVRQVKETFGKIDGVVFSIKQIYGKMIEEMDENEFHGAVMSKLKGAWIIDELTKDADLDFFITLSSISSIMGGPKNCDCTAVNMFLDAFGDYRLQQGRATTTINLTEIVTGDKHGYLLDVTMLPPIQYSQFIACFDRVLSKAYDLIVVSDFDLKIMKELLGVVKINFSDALRAEILAHGSSIESEKATAVLSGLSMEEVVGKITEMWKEVLGYDDMPENASFFEVGGTSLSAVKLLRLLRDAFQVQVEIADLYSYSTIRELAGYVKERDVQQADDMMDILNEFESGSMTLEDAAKLLGKV
ncbi:6-deoxyerythronolide-B synthase [Paenibacillus curdlanolyticus YK9]|uniref:6-deoxyerythronolide-B synthase n=1 Tax=Paenibacillus curdlanolyticus YK9 TaxID=717606 RepID=E0I748_9BACL|nr:beta-ketoacyl synthase N-terminal-like domain-containing protein [Paenibacillus curdlanolyticus]EFM11864.1 6-deoxyerythronolide-B synthase [Paenibacillus curdlanolyticus YK9]